MSGLSFSAQQTECEVKNIALSHCGALLLTFHRQTAMAFDQRQIKTLVYMAAAESYEMSDITPLDDFDKHITNAFKAKTVKLSVAFGALSLLKRVLCHVGKQLLLLSIFTSFMGRKKKAVQRTYIWYPSFSLSLEDAFRRGPRCPPCQMCPKINDMPGRKGAPLRMSRTKAVNPLDCTLQPLDRSNQCRDQCPQLT